MSIPFIKIPFAKGLWALIGATLLLALFYPLPFIADDWEHLAFYHRGQEPKILFWVYRNPFHSFFHVIYFPLFIQGQQFLAKLLLYPLQFLSCWLLLDVFLPEFREKFKKSYRWGLLPLFMAFPMNNYEWNFWPTMMTSFPALLVVCGGFWFDHYIKSLPSFLLKIICYLIGATTFECFIVLAWLLELARALYLLPAATSLWRRLLSSFNQIITPTLLFLMFKVVSQKLYPYGYAAEIGFKPHLFLQLLTVVFSVGYYKQFWSLGLPWLLGLGGLLVIHYRSPRHRQKIFHDLLLLLSFMAFCSFYYVVTNYSSRRALAAPLVFSWGAILIIYVRQAQRHWQRTSFKFFSALMALIYILHQGQIALIKTREQQEIIAMAQNLRQQIERAPTPLKLKTGFPRQYIKQRGWNFVDKVQQEGFILHFFSAEEQAKIILD